MISPGQRGIRTTKTADQPATRGSVDCFRLSSASGVCLAVDNVVTALATIPTASVDCVVTSPLPCLACGSDDIANAKAASGEQPTTEPMAVALVERLRQVFAEVARVLVPSGTAWLHLGDSYTTDADGRGLGQHHCPLQHCRGPNGDISAPSLLGLPWKAVFALQADGWILRSAVVCQTPEATSTPASSGLAIHYSLLFLLVRQPRYHFDLDPLRTPYTGTRALSRRAHRGGTRPHAASTDRTPWPLGPMTAACGGNPGDVWTIPFDREETGQGDDYPIAIPLRAIVAGCRPGGVVLDPFASAGTTGAAARRLGRAFIGIDPCVSSHQLVCGSFGHETHRRADRHDCRRSAS
ncbi:site-specific DNA-methyltransferase [Frankia sp. CNm7]|uniref:Methyltransferase n=1 Tax=Frankia nepalensis TaxID=1836974 RepID=A0A937RMZ5_9ACTN|nr:DNA methyltransferase [Frankia nepalensis]MBL7496179.1 site-specific DNA-methyltransferase [Frankia nepalensis]MBL7511589.1 site-specific DNA-methyltransferase [Frankia nepalensis]MBL7520641.1 site-specific DNA-methyltransferase [Frankia nepalensis]MBL7630264.1 site-specific DNA-methyltransferase [Frankia nepalensis]